MVASAGGGVTVDCGCCSRAATIRFSRRDASGGAGSWRAFPELEAEVSTDEASHNEWHEDDCEGEAFQEADGHGEEYADDGAGDVVGELECPGETGANDEDEQREWIDRHVGQHEQQESDRERAEYWILEEAQDRYGYDRTKEQQGACEKNPDDAAE